MDKPGTCKPVVLGLAASQPRAVLFAVDQARSFGSALRIVHSAALSPHGLELAVALDEAVFVRMRQEGQDVLERAREIVEAVTPGLPVEYILTELPALGALRSEAKDARSVVVGADDVPWFRRLLRTRIAGHLAMHAPCPVFVVPELDSSTSDDGEIVVTLDGRGAMTPALRLAFEEAFVRDCILHVLQAVPPGTVSSDVTALRSSLIEALAEGRRAYPDVQILEAQVDDDPEAVLERATRSADLVLVDRPRPEGLAVSLARPLAARVLARARCPVGIVPDDESNR